MFFSQADKKRLEKELATVVENHRKSEKELRDALKLDAKDSVALAVAKRDVENEALNAKYRSAEKRVLELTSEVNRQKDQVRFHHDRSLPLGNLSSPQITSVLITCSYFTLELWIRRCFISFVRVILQLF
jgi:hypothetical protein